MLMWLFYCTHLKIVSIFFTAIQHEIRHVRRFTVAHGPKLDCKLARFVFIKLSQLAASLVC